MDLRIFAVFTLVLCDFSSSSKPSDDKLPPEKFIPTSHWQKVEKGQPLPAGLHYRMNINTGETEAKLLDTEEPSSHESKTDLVALPNEINSENSDSSSYLSQEELKKILADVTADDSSSEQGQEDVKDKYRSYEELKKEFGELNLTVKTDMELLKELIHAGKEQIISKDDEERIVITLKDLEYLVHQIDNGREFIRLGGLENIVIPALNSSSAKVRAESLWLLGSASQSNPKVQIAVLNAGAMPMLLKAAVLDPDSVVNSRAIFALSCLSQQFPAAQAKLIDDGGLESLGGILSSGHSSDLKIKMRVLTLVHDFILERSDARRAFKEYETLVATSTSDATLKLMKHKQAELKEKIRQYEAVQLERRLVEGQWCQKVPDLLCKLHKSGANSGRSQRRDDLGSVVSKDVPYRPEHDEVEKVASLLLSLKNICFKEFYTNLKLKEVLRDFLEWYQDLSNREQMLGKYDSEVSPEATLEKSLEDDDMYYTTIAGVISELLLELNTDQNASNRNLRDEF